jgi:hypothetical protein
MSYGVRWVICWKFTGKLKDAVALVFRVEELAERGKEAHGLGTMDVARSS